MKEEIEIKKVSGEELDNLIKNTQQINNSRNPNFVKISKTMDGSYEINLSSDDYSLPELEKRALRLIKHLSQEQTPTKKQNTYLG